MAWCIGCSMEAQHIRATIQNPISGYEWDVSGDVISASNADSLDTTRYYIQHEGRKYVFFMSQGKKVLVDGTPAKYTHIEIN